VCYQFGDYCLYPGSQGKVCGVSAQRFVIDLLLTFLFLSGARVGIQLFLSSGREGARFRFLGKKNEVRDRVLIVGAGNAGEKLIREIKENPGINYDVAGSIDDDKGTWNQTIHGVPVLGSVDEVKRIAEGGLRKMIPV